MQFTAAQLHFEADAFLTISSFIWALVASVDLSVAENIKKTIAQPSNQYVLVLLYLLLVCKIRDGWIIGE